MSFQGPRRAELALQDLYRRSRKVTYLDIADTSEVRILSCLTTRKPLQEQYLFYGIQNNFKCRSELEHEWTFWNKLVWKQYKIEQNMTLYHNTFIGQYYSELCGTLSVFRWHWGCDTLHTLTSFKEKRGGGTNEGITTQCVLNINSTYGLCEKLHEHFFLTRWCLQQICCFLYQIIWIEHVCQVANL